jgi:hypothetical protein
VTARDFSTVAQILSLMKYLTTKLFTVNLSGTKPRHVDVSRSRGDEAVAKCHSATMNASQDGQDGLADVCRMPHVAVDHHGTLRQIYRGLQFCKVIVLDNHLNSNQHVKAPQMC